MRFVVKNTTYYGPLDVLCPHYCKGCGRLGTLLCGCCKKYICCKKDLKNLPERTFAYGRREGLLEKMIKEYKYGPVRGMAVNLAELLDEAIPESFIDGEVVVVPLPTIGRHVRVRGFDHTKLLAKKLARRRGWECDPLLLRLNDTVQVGATEMERFNQAKMAYGVSSIRTGEISAKKTYLLIDDILTTGASMEAATRVLKVAGAKEVYRAVLAASCG